MSSRSATRPGLNGYPPEPEPDPEPLPTYTPAEHMQMAVTRYAMTTQPVLWSVDPVETGNVAKFYVSQATSHLRQLANSIRTSRKRNDAAGKLVIVERLFKEAVTDLSGDETGAIVAAIEGRSAPAVALAEMIGRKPIADRLRLDLPEAVGALEALRTDLTMEAAQNEMTTTRGGVSLDRVAV